MSVEVMDQLIVRLQNVIGQLETRCLSEETQEEISHVLGLIKDASVSRHVRSTINFIVNCIILFALDNYDIL